MTTSRNPNNTVKPEITIKTAGEDSVIVYIDATPSRETSNLIAQLNQQLQLQIAPCIVDTIPSYISLWVQYRFELLSHQALIQLINRLWSNHAEATEKSHLFYSADDLPADTQTAKPRKCSKEIILPVYYGKECSPDIDRITDLSGLSREQIIELHSQTSYTVYAIGFAPGFAYLGEIDPRMATPRLATPRSHVPKGAVAVADQQTAIYPADSPGGWNIIGNCPLEMFNPDNVPASPFTTGNTVKFRAIDRDEFIALGGNIP